MTPFLALVLVAFFVFIVTLATVSVWSGRG